MKIRCIVADDEPLARKGIENFIREIPFLEPIASCSSAMEAMDVLSREQIDLVFLDIQMPKMTGIELLRNLSHPPVTIITTAYSHYAVESYELTVVDYLLKPIPFDRFAKAVSKAKDYLELRANKPKQGGDPADFCFIKCDKVYEKIFYNEIQYIEALQNYVVINVGDKKYTTYLTLKSVEDQLPASLFLKISKSYIVNIQKIDSLDGSILVVDKHRLTIGRSFKDTVTDVILKDRLLKR